MTKDYTGNGGSKTPPQEVIEIALQKIDAFEPFSYNDLGLKKRRDRDRFRKWAEDKPLVFRRVPISRNGGSRAKIFFPFRYDEKGNQILAPLPAKEESSVN